MIDKDEAASGALRRAALATLVLAHMLFAGTAALAQAPAGPARVAVLSLIGERLLIVGSNMSTGSRLDRNAREFIDLPADDFDLTTARDFELRARREKPGTALVAIRSRDKVLREMQEDVLAGRREVKDLAARLRPALGPQGITHLVLVTKYRGDARIRIADGAIGLGRLEGLGFYVDRWTPMVRADIGARGSGFLAPFAYFTATLLEVATLEVLAQASAAEAAAFGTTDAPGATHPWDALDAEQKTKALREFVRRGLEQVVPKIAARLPG